MIGQSSYRTETFGASGVEGLLCLLDSQTYPGFPRTRNRSAVGRHPGRVYLHHTHLKSCIEAPFQGETLMQDRT